MPEQLAHEQRDVEIVVYGQAVSYSSDHNARPGIDNQVVEQGHVLGIVTSDAFSTATAVLPWVWIARSSMWLGWPPEIPIATSAAPASMIVCSYPAPRRLTPSGNTRLVRSVPAGSSIVSPGLACRSRLSRSKGTAADVCRALPKRVKPTKQSKTNRASRCRPP